jgi:KaiC/GvpD/RAD55 family RecA-like ATPase
MTEPTNLYAALVAIGVAPDDAKRIANAGQPDLEAAIVAAARKFRQVQRALDALEDGIATFRRKIEERPVRTAVIAAQGGQTHDTMRRHHIAQRNKKMRDAVSALNAVIERSNDLTTLLLEHGDAFHEFLDSL